MLLKGTTVFLRTDFLRGFRGAFGVGKGSSVGFINLIFKALITVFTPTTITKQKTNSERLKTNPNKKEFNILFLFFFYYNLKRIKEIQNI